MPPRCYKVSFIIELLWADLKRSAILTYSHHIDGDEMSGGERWQRPTEVLLELPLLRLCTDGAAAFEAGSDIVMLGVGAPGKSSEASDTRAFSNSANTQPSND